MTNTDTADDLKKKQPSVPPPLVMPGTAPGYGGPSPMVMPALPRPPASETPVQAAHVAGQREYQAGMPKLTAAPFTPESYQQKESINQYQKAHPWGSDVSAHPGTMGKVGHVLGRIGNIAGDVLAPRATEMIPGSDLNRAAQTAGNEAGFEKAQAEDTAKQGAAARTTEAETGQKRLPIEQETADAAKARAEQQKEGNPEQQAYDGYIAQGMTPTDAYRKVLADQQAAKPVPGDIGKMSPEIEAQIGASPDPKDYPGGAKDPKYKADRAAWGKQAEGVKNQEAAASGAARGSAYNESRPVQVLKQNPDGSFSPVYTTAGEAEKQGLSTAAQGSKALSQTAQMNDIVNASQKVREAIGETGMTAFTPAQTAKLSMAMKENDPSVMRDEIANLAASGLSPAQQDLVTWLYQLQERALSLRSVAGMGQGSETTRMAILKALPGITSGNPQMAIKQLDAFDNMVSNLSKGVLNVKGSQRAGSSGETQHAAPGEPPKTSGPPQGVSVPQGWKWQQQDGKWGITDGRSFRPYSGQ